MKVNVYYGKVSALGNGDIDNLLIENVDLNEVDNYIYDNKRDIIKGWSNVKNGDYIELLAFNEENDEIVNSWRLDLC